MANLQIVISALNKASGEINKVKGEIKGVGDTGKVAEGGVKGFGASLSSVIGTAAMVAGAIAGVSVAIKEVIEAAKEGAAFQRMEEASASLARSLDADMSEIMDALLEADTRHSTRELAVLCWEVCDLIQRETNTPPGAKIEVLNVSAGGLIPRPENDR